MNNVRDQPWLKVLLNGGDKLSQRHHVRIQAAGRKRNDPHLQLINTPDDKLHDLDTFGAKNREDEKT